MGAALVACGAAGCRLGDLVNTPHTAPSAPVNLAQTLTDGTTAIPTGQFTPQPSVVLSGRVSDPDAGDRMVLQVEVQAVGVAFGDSATATSDSVPTDTVAAVAVSGLEDNGAYHWQARTVDGAGRASAWVPYGGNAETAVDFGVDAVVEPPSFDPASLAQLKSDGTTSIAVGGTTDQDTVVFQAAVSDPDPGDSLRLQIESQPLGAAFTGNPTGTSGPVAGGGTARVTISGQPPEQSYRWQARAIDRGGLASAWTPFGGNPDVQADYRISIPGDPYSPGNLGQYRAPGGAQPIAVGDTTHQTSVVLKAVVTDPNPGDQLRLEVEVREVGVAFSNAATAPASAAVSYGSTADVTVLGLVGGRDYHWQARVLDQTGRASAWVQFGGNGDLADFRVR